MPPVAPRIHSLDILRGLALAGMILVHFHQKMELPADGFEDLIGWFIWIAVETKAWGIFAVLFGAGFAVLLRNLQAKGIRPVAVYLRRLAGLAVFGFIAEAFFGFHILLAYALWGVPLLAVRNWRSWALLVLAVASVVASPVAAVLTSALEPGAPPPAILVETRQAEEHLRAAEQAGDYAALVRARVDVMRRRARDWLSYLPDTNLALFIVGLLAIRHRVFAEPRRHLRLISAAGGFGLCAWTAHWSLFAFGPEATSPAMAARLSGFGLLQDQFLCLTYMGVLLVALDQWPARQRGLSGIAWAGRMALTNYLLQVAALDVMSSGYGLALRVRPLWDLAGTAILFGLLVVWSRAWLTRFNYGPAEWAWRMFTYLRVVPNRRLDAAAVGS